MSGRVMSYAENLATLKAARDAAVLVNLLTPEAELCREALLELKWALQLGDLAFFRARGWHIANFEKKLAECPEEVRAELERHAALVEWEQKSYEHHAVHARGELEAEVAEAYRRYMRWKHINAFLLSEEGRAFPAGFECTPGFRGAVEVHRREAQACTAIYRALATVEARLNALYR